MSTLTKVLIVILALSTFALCAMVSIYVATSASWKERYTTESRTRSASDAAAEQATKDLNDAIAKAQQSEDQLKRQLNDVGTQLQSLQVKIADLEREKGVLEQQVSGWASTVEGWTRTKEQQAKLLEEKLAETAKIQAELIELQKELNEVSASLLEERAASDDLKRENRLLAEAKQQLQAKVDQGLAGYGRETTTAASVTPRKEAVPTAPELTRPISLEGLITELDMANKLASISLGKADGVRAGMKFFATRGEQFVCEIFVTDVDAEESVGIITRMPKEYSPKVGDVVSTNL